MNLDRLHPHSNRTHTSSQTSANSKPSSQWRACTTSPLRERMTFITEFRVSFILCKASIKTLIFTNGEKTMHKGALKNFRQKGHADKVWQPPTRCILAPPGAVSVSCYTPVSALYPAWTPQVCPPLPLLGPIRYPPSLCHLGLLLTSTSLSPLAASSPM